MLVTFSLLARAIGFCVCCSSSNKMARYLGVEYGKSAGRPLHAAYVQRIRVERSEAGIRSSVRMRPG